jgi:arylsulfatase A-like enzyme
MDGAGLAIPTAVEGKSMFDVLRGKSWRDTLDLEHASCYEPKDGWVALVGQRYKYIYYTITGEQQLFDLANDPHELYDLAPDPASASVVKEWRKKMIQHLSARGEDWVSDNDLVIQPKAVIRRANPPFATASHE